MNESLKKLEWSKDDTTPGEKIKDDIGEIAKCEQSLN